MKDIKLDQIEARRAFLARAGKFAIATPPAVALLLSASKQNYAAAASGVVCGSTH